MRVGLIHYGLDRETTGIGRYTLELANALRESHVEVYPLWAGTNPNDPDGASLHGAYRLPGLLTVGQQQIASVAERLALDVVHDPVGVMPLVLTKAVRVVTIHDAVPYVKPETSTWLDWLVYHAWLPSAIRAANVIVTVSNHSREDILTLLPAQPGRTVTVPLAADDRFRPISPTKAAPILRQHDIKQPYILYVGALESRKNLPRLIEAFHQIRQRSNRWKLVVVGARKWKFSPIFDKVQQLGLASDVQFTGYVADEHLPALYSAADLFTFPSLYEGFGLPVLEAMACGTPVVTSNSSSLPEVAGDAAILVDPRNVEQLANAMWLALSQPAVAAKLRAQGLLRAAQFSWQRTAQETIAVYENVLAEKRS